MGRTRCGQEFDVGEAAVRAIEVLTGDAVPDERWRQRYFILDARHRVLKGLRDRVEKLEGEVDDLETERDELKEKQDELREDRDEHRERVKDVEKTARTALRLLVEGGKGVMNEAMGLMEEIAEDG